MPSSIENEQAALSGLLALGPVLLESDRRYFAAGAIVERLDDARLTRLEGLEQVPGGCVIDTLEPGARSPESLVVWLSALKVSALRAGADWCRLYAESESSRLVDALRATGFRRRVEIGLAARAGEDGGQGAVDLVRIDDERGWREKQQLHESSPDAPDGHRYRPTDWVRLERIKAEAGYMTPYLIRRDGMTVGALAAAPHGRLCRLKNVVVHAATRRQGIAESALGAFSALAARQGCDFIACFALEGEPGESAYRRFGMVEVVRQAEWLAAVR